MSGILKFVAMFLGAVIAVSTSIEVLGAESGAPAQSVLAGKYVGEIKGPGGRAVWASTVGSDGSFQGWFRHAYSQTTGYEAILNGTVLADGKVNAAGTARKYKLIISFGSPTKSENTGSFHVTLSGEFAGGAFWGKVAGESELVDVTAERVFSSGSPDRTVADNRNKDANDTQPSRSALVAAAAALAAAAAVAAAVLLKGAKSKSLAGAIPPPHAPPAESPPEESVRLESSNVPQEAVPASFEWPPGTITEHNPDGTIIKRLPDGTVATGYTDGTVHAEYPDRTTITDYPDGTVKTWRPDGTTFIERPNGTTEITNPDGTTATITPDNRVQGTLIDKDGLRYTVDTIGETSSVSVEGEVEIDGEMTEVSGNENGIKVSWKDGSTAKLGPDGGLSEAHFLLPGVTLDLGAKGLHAWDNKGNDLKIKPDGTLDWTDQDGNKLSEKPDGTISFTTPEGAKLTANPDGTGSVSAANGAKAIMNKDGSWTIEESGGISTTHTPEQLKTMADNSGLGGRGVGGLSKQVREA